MRDIGCTGLIDPCIGMAKRLKILALRHVEQSQISHIMRKLLSIGVVQFTGLENQSGLKRLCVVIGDEIDMLKIRMLYRGNEIRGAFRHGLG